MREFRISKKAAFDIKEISRYTTLEFGDEQALKYKKGMYGVFQNLADSPDLGRDTASLIPHSKRYNYEAHSIFYMTTDTGIFIFRVLGQKQDFERHL